MIRRIRYPYRSGSPPCVCSCTPYISRSLRTGLADEERLVIYRPSNGRSTVTIKRRYGTRLYRFDALYRGTLLTAARRTPRVEDYTLLAKNKKKFLTRFERGQRHVRH